MKGSGGDQRSTNLKLVLHNRIAMAGSFCYTFQECRLAAFASIFHFNKSSHQHHCQLIHGALPVTNLGCEIRKRIGKYQVFGRIHSQGFTAILQEKRVAAMASTRPISSFFQAPKRLKVTNENDPPSSGNNVSNNDPVVEIKIDNPTVTPSEEKAEPESATLAVEELSASQGEKTLDVSQEQKMRMEINKSAARAKRNLRLCEERVAEAKAAGVAFPEMVQLLVDQSWLEILQGELQKQYIDKLAQFVRQEVAGKYPIYPPAAKVFNAFNTCPLNNVKVVILGQDPYHGAGQAMGLSFSVPQGIKVPPSLVNIYKEIQADVGCSIPSHGNLEKWAYQGVLLLNAVLTVRDHHANSHAKKGWEMFTDAAIRAVSQHRTGVVFLLWGNSAQEKIRLINAKAHHILKAAHPSGLSAHRGFFGCRHFSQTNKLLEKGGHLPIDWQL